MADKPLPWFRLYSEMISDRKITAISRLTSCSRLEVIGALTTLLALASESPIRGHLLITQNIPYEISDFVDVFELPPPDVEKLLQAIQKLEIIDFVDGTWIILNWNKRQYKSDDSYDRVTKFRETHKSNATVTPGNSYSNGFVTPPETDTESDTESDKEKEAPRAPSDFLGMQQLIEELTCYPIPPTDESVKAINEFIKIGATEADFKDALSFLSENNIIAYGPKSLLGSVKTAVRKRVQKNNGSKPKSLEDQGYHRIGSDK